MPPVPTANWHMYLFFLIPVAKPVSSTFCERGRTGNTEYNGQVRMSTPRPVADGQCNAVFSSCNPLSDLRYCVYLAKVAELRVGLLHYSNYTCDALLHCRVINYCIISVDYCWLLLIIVEYCWLLLITAITVIAIIAITANYCKLLQITDYCWTK